MNQNSDLDCILYLRHTNLIKNNLIKISRKLPDGVKDYVFKDNLVSINNKGVYMNRLNEIHLTINPKKKKKIEQNYHKKKNNTSSHKALIISISIVIRVIVIGIVIAIALYLYKKRSINNYNE